MMYRLYVRLGKTVAYAAMTVDSNPAKAFLFDPTNYDYQSFKDQINDDTAQLQDVDGVTMSSSEAKAFVKELP